MRPLTPRRGSASTIALGVAGVIFGIALPGLAGLGSTRNCTIGVEAVNSDPMRLLQGHEDLSRPINRRRVPFPL